MRTWIRNHKNRIISAFLAFCLCAGLFFLAGKGEDNTRAAMVKNSREIETEALGAAGSDISESAESPDEEKEKSQDDEKITESEAIEVGGVYKNGKFVTKTIKNVFDLNTLHTVNDTMAGKSKLSDTAKIESAEIPSSVVLNIPVLLQMPELPTGCEATSLTILLMYDGYQIDKTTIVDEYLIYSKTGTFEDGYIGDPYSYEGAGCFPDTIVKTANRFLEAYGGKTEGIDLTGKNFHTLLRYIAAGRPVAVWTSLYLLDPGIDLRGSTYGGYVWYEMEHCVVLAGYDLENDKVIISDPMQGVVEYSLQWFQEVYERVGQYAVVIL